jgi:uncharacterized protein (TIGR02147 family)
MATLNVFAFEDYREFLKAYLKFDDDRNPGARKRLQISTGISSSLLTQIFSEKKQLSREQAIEVASHIELLEKETDYFLLMVDHSHAGTPKLRQRISAKMLVLKKESEQIASKVNAALVLNDEQKTIYYSSWIYTAVRNLVPTGQCQSIHEFAEKLHVPRSKAEGAIEFLLQLGLIKKVEKGFEYRAGHTHLTADHPMILRHHQNWRQRAIQRMDHYTDEHMHYTCPMSVSKEGAKIIKARLIEEIKNLNKSLSSDHPEVAYCLNIDFFEY